MIQKTDDQIELLSLASYANATHNDNSEYLFCFFDTCSLEKHPGWMLRNYLFLINQKFGRNLVKVVCIRSHSKASQLPSLVMDIALHIDVESSPESSVERNFEAVGLEPHMSGKLCPRMLDLSAQMDPLRLAESSVDLNIRLMRWRLLTSLNIELISNLRCLIIGAGTLGCNVALTLQGWGVKNIDFVDNGKVSFSNPVRQPLYDFEDSKIGKFKAIAASERLKKIFPMMVRYIIFYAPLFHPKLYRKFS